MKIDFSKILLIILLLLFIVFGIYQYIEKNNLNKEIDTLKDKMEDVVLRQSEILDSFNDQILLNITTIRQDITNLTNIYKTNFNELKENLDYFRHIYTKIEESLTAYNNAWNTIAGLLGYEELRINTINE